LKLENKYSLGKSLNVLYVETRLIVSLHIYIIFMLCAVCSCIAINAQDLKVSTPQKIPSKVSEYEILGKTNEGLIVWKSGLRYNLIEAFDPYSMDLNWSRELTLPRPKVRVVEIVVFQNELYVFYVNKVKTISTLYAVKFNSQLRKISEEKEIDVYKRRLGVGGYKYNIRFDIKKANLVLVKLEKVTEEDVHTIPTIKWIDKKLNIIGERSSEVENNWKFQDCFVASNGTVFLVKQKTKRTILTNKPLFEEIVIESYHLDDINTKRLVFRKEKKLFNEFNVQYDEQNDKLVLAGFYSGDKQSNTVEGYFYTVCDLTKTAIYEESFSEFDEEFVSKVARKGLFDKDSQLQYFEVRNLILRRDGGALLVGESYSRVGANNSMMQFYDMRFSNRRNVQTEHYFDDVILFSINPDGTLHWNEILKKRQFSEDDDGYFSSVGFMNSSKSLNLLFNESISHNNKLSSFFIEHDGEYQMKSIFNPASFQLTPAPRYAKQISANELIIPAVSYKNEFVLVKVTF